MRETAETPHDPAVVFGLVLGLLGVTVTPHQFLFGAEVVDGVAQQLADHRPDQNTRLAGPFQMDPIRAARGGFDLGSELTMHYGLLPRALGGGEAEARGAEVRKQAINLDI